METTFCPELEPGERTLILVTHDESCFDPMTVGVTVGWMKTAGRFDQQEMDAV
jgi:hypothetical protein